MNLPSLLFVAALAPTVLAQHDTVRRINLTPTGEASEGYCYDPVITPDGNFVLFKSEATDLTVPPGVLPFASALALYRYDVRNGVTEQVNFDNAGLALSPALTAGNGPGARAAISDDGTKVMWMSPYNSIASGDLNGRDDIYVRDLTLGTTTLVSGLAGGSTSGFSHTGSMSADGRYVAFISSSASLVPGLVGTVVSDNNQSRRLFLHDTTLGQTTLVSALNGGVFNGDESVYDALISPDGETLVYSEAGHPISYGGFSSKHEFDVHVVDRSTGAEVVYPEWTNARSFSMSADASRIAFTSNGSVGVAGTGAQSPYVLERSTGVIEFQGSNTLGTEATQVHDWTSISRDGRYLQSQISNAPAYFKDMGPMGATQVVFKDLETGLATMTSRNSKGEPGYSVELWDRAFVGPGMTLSGDGSISVFYSNYNTLPGNNVGGDTNIYIHERRFGERNLWADLVAGQTADFSIPGMTPGGLALLGVSTTGQGPFASYWGAIDLSPPLFMLSAVVDANGEAHFPAPIPAGMAGRPLWAKGLDVAGSAVSTSFFGFVQ